MEDRHQAQLGGGQMPVSATQALAYFQQAGFELLEVKPEHAVGVERLPLLHPDAFDRLLIAQARWEPMRLLTRDAKMLAYGDGIEAA
ncbi:MAG: type II toxin-antitoxin system VapC family toxin [Lysobacterales bacterium]